MKERVHHVPLPVIHIVDMREEQGDIPYSRVLLESLQETLRAGKKGILFLNRRGYATVLQCRTCGYVFKCPHCDVSLVYHKERHSLHCHYCESVFLCRITVHSAAVRKFPIWDTEQKRQKNRLNSCFPEFPAAGWIWTVHPENILHCRFLKIFDEVRLMSS